MLTSFQQHVPHKHFGGKITSCTIAGRRCYRTRMYEVIWSNHNLTVLPIKPHISLAPTALLSELCKLHSSFSNQSTLIKIPACKPVRARAEEASEPDTGIHPLLRTCTGSEAQRSLMCTGVFLRVGTQAWCRRRAETIGGSTSSPHTHNPCVSQELFILHLHPPLFFSFFFCPSWCLHTETLKRSVCGFACDSLMFNSPGRSQTDSGTHSVHVCAKTQHREAEHKDEGAQWESEWLSLEAVKGNSLILRTLSLQPLLNELTMRENFCLWFI